MLGGMAYANPHLLLAFSGTLPGSEVWSCGIRAKSTLGYNQAEADALGAAVVAAWSTFWAVSANAIGTTAFFDKLALRALDETGVTLDLNEYFPVAPVAGASTVSKPNQCAIVVTTLTNTPSRRGRGRFYIPSLGTSTMSAGRMAVTQRDSIATTAKTCLDAINSALTTFEATAELAVESNVGAGQESAITGLRVGDVIDTQRRRRDGLVESYTSRALA